MITIPFEKGKIDFFSIPEKSGVYFFIGKNNEKLYIGKAKNLRSRLRSYFSKDFSFHNPQKAHLISELKKIKIEVLESEIEALIRESLLIKKYKPKYNVIFKDDKNYFFVGFTKEIFPKIIIAHQIHVKNFKVKIKNWIGPFVSGRALKITLKTLRKVFPYCTCLKTHQKPCLNAQIGLCRGFCCLENTFKTQSKEAKLLLKDLFQNKLEYQKNINAIKRVLSGKSKKLLKDLNQEMLKEAENENFEKAQIIKNKILAFERIISHKKVFEKNHIGNFVINDKIIIEKTIIDFSKVKKIEAFDVSILQGKNPVGAMVVFEKDSNGFFMPQKTHYRRFKIKNIKGNNDPAMIAQIIQRRFKHKKWIMPDLILIDGGKAQLNEALKNLKKFDIHKDIIFIALAKREELVYTVDNKNPVKIDTLPEDVGLLFKAIRDEAHRFAINFHKHLREKSLYV